jgi:chemotaxis protein CheD
MIKEIVRLGEIIFTKNPNKFTMLGIGTCLAIFMYDLRRGFYGIAHTVLPTRVSYHRGSSMEARYTDEAIATMVQRFSIGGYNKRDIKVKVVGGNSIFSDHFNIAKDNIRVARKTLKVFNIEIIYEKVGNNFGQSIHEFNSDGSMKLKTNGEFHII